MIYYTVLLEYFNNGKKEKRYKIFHSSQVWWCYLSENDGDGSSNLFIPKVYLYGPLPRAGVEVVSVAAVLTTREPLAAGAREEEAFP